MFKYIIKGSIIKTPDGCVFGQHIIRDYTRKGYNSSSEEFKNDLRTSPCHLHTNDITTNGNMVIMGEYVVAVNDAYNITGYGFIRKNDKELFFYDWLVQNINNNIQLIYPGTHPNYHFADLNNDFVEIVNVTGHAEKETFIFK